MEPPQRRDRPRRSCRSCAGTSRTSSGSRRSPCPGVIDAPLLEAFELTSKLFADAGVEVGRLDLPDTAPVVVGAHPRAARRADGPALQPLRRRARRATRRCGTRRRSSRPSATARSSGAASADTKSNILMHVGALRAWDGRPPVGVKICIEGYEEIGSGALTSYPPTDPELFRADTLIIGDMGSIAPGIPTLTTALRGMGNVTLEVRTLESGQHSGQYGGAAPDALLAILHAIATLHDEHGDVAVAGLRRDEWQGPAQTEEQFRDLGTVLDGVPLIGTGGLGRASGRGPRSPSSGSTCRRWTARSTRSPRTRARCSTSACIPSRTRPRRRRRSSSTCAPCARSASTSTSGPGRPATASRPRRTAGLRRRARGVVGRVGRRGDDRRQRRVDPDRRRARGRAPRRRGAARSARRTATRTSTAPTSGCCSASSRTRSLAEADFFGRYAAAFERRRRERRGLRGARAARRGFAERALAWVEQRRQQGPEPGDPVPRPDRRRDRALAGPRLGSTSGVDEPRRRPGRRRRRPPDDLGGRPGERRGLQARHRADQRARACSPPTASASCSRRSCRTSSGFAAVGVILVAMVGVGVAEYSGPRSARSSASSSRSPRPGR